MGKGWKVKLPDALWAYWTAYEMPIRMAPYRLLWENIPPSVELQHCTHWAIQNWNIDFQQAGKHRKF